MFAVVLLIVILTNNFFLKLILGEVRSKPSIFPHAVNDIGPLSRRVSLGNVGAILHVYVAKADSNAILGQLEVAPQSCIGCAGDQRKRVGV